MKIINDTDTIQIERQIIPFREFSRLRFNLSIEEELTVRLSSDAEEI